MSLIAEAFCRIRLPSRNHAGSMLLGARSSTTRSGYQGQPILTPCRELPAIDAVEESRLRAKDRRLASTCTRPPVRFRPEFHSETGVTEHPTAAWTAQQIVEAFAEREPARYVIRDRGSIYGSDVRLRPARSPHRSCMIAITQASQGHGPLADCHGDDRELV
jgi:hypothetical protein